MSDDTAAPQTIVIDGRTVILPDTVNARIPLTYHPRDRDQLREVLLAVLASVDEFVPRYSNSGSTAWLTAEAPLPSGLSLHLTVFLPAGIIPRPDPVPSITEEAEAFVAAVVAEYRA